MDSNSLDKYIKDKLIQLDGGDPLDSWHLLSKKLDASELSTSSEDLDFDSRVKDAVENISAIEIPDWETFLPNLQLEENLDDIQTDIALDNTIKASLLNLEVPYDENTWDTLAHKIEVFEETEMTGSTDEIDQLAYEKLINYTVPQRAGDWEAFSKELDKEFILPLRLLFKYKLAEIAILASLILLFIQVKPILLDQIDSRQVNNSVDSIVKEFQASDTVSFKSNTLNLPTIAKEYTTIAETELLPNSKRNPDVTTIDKLVVSNNITQSEVETKNEGANSGPYNTANVAGVPLMQKNRPIGLTDENPNIVYTEVLETSTKLINAATTKEEDEKSELNLLRFNLTRLPAKALLGIDYKENMNLPGLQSSIVTNSILNWRLGAHLDTEYTYIMTAYDNIFDLSSYNHGAIGYGTGLTLSAIMGNWEIESGFTYSTRQYTPNARTERLGSLTLGYLIVELDKIQMNLLSVPLSLRYHFNNKSAKTHFYMQGGASLHVATQASYFLKSDFLGSSKRPSLTDSKDLVKSSNTSSDKVYSSGWFEGGSYIENRYFTLSIGVGFERKISSRYSIFGHTTYAQYLDRDGIGPNRDRFNSIGISTGVRALFK